MPNKYNSLDELRRKKALLKNDVSEIEELLTFENTKESLGALTNGFTDRFLEEKPDGKGDTKVALKTNVIMKEISNEVKEKVMNKNTVRNLAATAAGTGLAEDMLKMGAVAFAGNLAKKNLNHSSWKKKLIGLALVYIAPILLRYLRGKIDDYQRQRSLAGMGQII